jgi:hypothetical protein
MSRNARAALGLSIVSLSMFAVVPAAQYFGLRLVGQQVAWLLIGGVVLLLPGLTLIVHALLLPAPRSVEPRPDLELLEFDSGIDGMVKEPEFGWGPAAWMRLRVRNRSTEAPASDVRVAIRRVIAHGPDGRYKEMSARHTRNNLANLHFKVADIDATVVPNLAPNEERRFDIAKLNAASGRKRLYWGLVINPPHRDLREELFIGTEYDLEIYVVASNGLPKSYTARLACTGWPCSPPWPCDESPVWKALTVRLQAS